MKKTLEKMNPLYVQSWKNGMSLPGPEPATFFFVSAINEQDGSLLKLKVESSDVNDAIERSYFQIAKKY